MELLLFVLAGAAALAYWAWQQHRRAERREALFALAHRLGVSYSRTDDGSLRWLPFAFFRQGDDRGVENVLSGTVDGEPFRVFDFWYLEEHTDSDGHQHERTYRFSCATCEVDASFPRIRISPETVASRLKDLVGLRDIDFESEAFNRDWNVRCDDRRAAYAVIDAQMISWLLMTGDDFQFEVSDQYLLLVTDQAAPERFPILHKALLQFRDRIPAVARELYPA